MSSLRILLATDAWEPQVNGVVRTYQKVCEELKALGHEIVLVSPNDFKTLPCPTYPEIRLAMVSARRLAKILDESQPDVVHIATEGPIGWGMRRACLKSEVDFTTAYHTRFPEYIRKRFPLPLGALYSMMRRFHNAGGGTMVATASLLKELEMRGFEHLLKWNRGVNTDLFHPRDCRQFGDERVALYVGRVAVEKNLETFFKAPFQGRKVVVGDGPSLKAFKEQYKDVTFTGAKQGEALASCYASADVFVFPSLTDTFGIVMLEALASGLPIAAFPVTGPIDVVEPGVTGILDQDLGQAIRKAMVLDKKVCREKALDFSWRQCADQFLENLVSAKSLVNPRMVGSAIDERGDKQAQIN